MIRIVSKPGCFYCEQAKALLTDIGAPFEQELLDPLDTEVYEGRREELIATTGARTFPFIYLQSKFLGGFQELKAAYATGHLQAEFKKLGVMIREPDF